MRTKHPAIPIFICFVLIFVAVVNLYFPAILSAALLVTGGFLAYTLYRLEQE